MAPSGNRRPGYSRKAQYGLFFGYVAAITGALIALLLLAAAVFDPQGFGTLRGFVSDVTAPASSSARGATRGVGSIGDRISAYIDAGSKNHVLNAEVEENRTRLIEARAIAYENARLKRMLRLVEQRPEAVVTARLVSSSGSSSRRFAILSAGKGSDVAVGMPVRAPEGLIGRIEAVGRSTARVMLLTDGGMVIPVRRADDGLPAISTGTGNGALDIRPLSTGANPFKPGDVLVTSGTGGVYAPNVPVAIITRVAGDSATGMPLANPGRVDFAVVEPLFQPEAAAPAAPPVAP